MAFILIFTCNPFFWVNFLGSMFFWVAWLRATFSKDLVFGIGYFGVTVFEVIILKNSLSKVPKGMENIMNK